MIVGFKDHIRGVEVLKCWRHGRPRVCFDVLSIEQVPAHYLWLTVSGLRAVWTLGHIQCMSHQDCKFALKIGMVSLPFQ